ncbi:hypothetical protein [Arthrobacter sp. STN4]|uniref:hypothetical protein n=1 Tax=Arthrobacter sp. STN4 TaxID=2923276 RepID=UPI002119C664|nr:hypothetical protein [Arthrobacter sp. STN4]MCQ9163918.1 hypothetical protein [Arthrobacter sp. STN4]
MDANPMVRPQIYTGPLVATTTVAAFLLIVAAVIVIFGWPPLRGAWIFLAVTVAAGALLAWGWSKRLHQRALWDQFATRQWDYMARAKEEHETTTEITVLGFQESHPTGAWATIRWEKFGYVQPAWIANGSFPIWPATVLLIRPDPAQIMVGYPWPATYYIGPHDCLAVAPATTKT